MVKKLKWKVIEIIKGKRRCRFCNNLEKSRIKSKIRGGNKVAEWQIKRSKNKRERHMELTTNRGRKKS